MFKELKLLGAAIVFVAMPLFTTGAVQAGSCEGFASGCRRVCAQTPTARGCPCGPRIAQCKRTGRWVTVFGEVKSVSPTKR